MTKFDFDFNKKMMARVPKADLVCAIETAAKFKAQDANTPNKIEKMLELANITVLLRYFTIANKEKQNKENPNDVVFELNDLLKLASSVAKNIYTDPDKANADERAIDIQNFIKEKLGDLSLSEGLNFNDWKDLLVNYIHKECGALIETKILANQECDNCCCKSFYFEYSTKLFGIQISNKIFATIGVSYPDNAYNLSVEECDINEIHIALLDPENENEIADANDANFAKLDIVRHGMGAIFDLLVILNYMKGIDWILEKVKNELSMDEKNPAIFVAHKVC